MGQKPRRSLPRIRPEPLLKRCEWTEMQCDELQLAVTISKLSNVSVMTISMNSKSETCVQQSYSERKKQPRFEDWTSGGSWNLSNRHFGWGLAEPTVILRLLLPQGGKGRNKERTRETYIELSWNFHHVIFILCWPTMLQQYRNPCLASVSETAAAEGYAPSSCDYGRCWALWTTCP